MDKHWFKKLRYIFLTIKCILHSCPLFQLSTLFLFVIKLPICKKNSKWNKLHLENWSPIIIISASNSFFIQWIKRIINFVIYSTMSTNFGWPKINSCENKEININLNPSSMHAELNQKTDLIIHMKNRKLKKIIIFNTA